MAGENPKIPKTGLARRMREWMRGRTRPFTLGALGKALGTGGGSARKRAARALRDFAARGEVVRAGSAFRYNPGWRRKQTGVILPRILKAMYLSVTFTAAEIVRLSGAGDKSHAGKTIRRLRRAGFVGVSGRRPLTGGGAENIYTIADRVKFRTDLM